MNFTNSHKIMQFRKSSSNKLGKRALSLLFQPSHNLRRCFQAGQALILLRIGHRDPMEVGSIMAFRVHKGAILVNLKMKTHNVATFRMPVTLMLKIAV